MRDQHNRLLPVSIVARRLTISISSVYRAIEGGKLKAIRTTGVKGYRVAESELNRYIEVNTTSIM